MMLEKDIEHKLVSMVEGLGGWCLKFTCPGQTGVPDRICVLPGGITFWAELKKPKGGILSPKQKLWRDRLFGVGHNYALIRSVEDIERLKYILGIMMEEKIK